MYLKALNDEQKLIFWKLANVVVMVDGGSTQQENDLLTQYLTELEKEYEIFSPNEIDIESEINKLKDGDSYIKKIMLRKALPLLLLSIWVIVCLLSKTYLWFLIMIKSD